MAVSTIKGLSQTNLTLSSVQNCTAKSCIAVVDGKVCDLYLHVTANIAMSAGTNYTLGTLPLGYRPINIAFIGNNVGVGVITSSGSVSIRPTVSQGSGSNLYLQATYIIA